MLAIAGAGLSELVPYADVLGPGFLVWYAVVFRAARGRPALHRVLAPMQPSWFERVVAATGWPRRAITAVQGTAMLVLLGGTVARALT